MKNIQNKLALGLLLSTACLITNNAAAYTFLGFTLPFTSKKDATYPNLQQFASPDLLKLCKEMTDENQKASCARMELMLFVTYKHAMDPQNLATKLMAISEGADIIDPRTHKPLLDHQIKYIADVLEKARAENKDQVNSLEKFHAVLDAYFKAFDKARQEGLTAAANLKAVQNVLAESNKADSKQ